MKYQVDHPNTSGGPTFTALWGKNGALGYIGHCMKHGNGNDYMTIIKIEGN